MHIHHNFSFLNYLFSSSNMKFLKKLVYLWYSKYICDTWQTQSQWQTEGVIHILTSVLNQVWLPAAYDKHISLVLTYLVLGVTQTWLPGVYDEHRSLVLTYLVLGVTQTWLPGVYDEHRSLVLTYLLLGVTQTWSPDVYDKHRVLCHTSLLSLGVA